MFFFFNDTATTEIYTLSLHDALPICDHGDLTGAFKVVADRVLGVLDGLGVEAFCASGDPFDPALHEAVMHDTSADRKSTRLNSSHANISYAVFCLKKKKLTTASYPVA